MTDGNESENREKILNHRAEYHAVGQLVGPTATLRFATAAAFFAFNGFILSQWDPEKIGLLRGGLMTLAALVGNFVFVLLEFRTRDAHRALMSRGSTLEDKQHLSIENGVYSGQATRGSLPLGHGTILIATYVAASSVGRYFPFKGFTG
jgi:hypothetical protein